MNATSPFLHPQSAGNYSSPMEIFKRLPETTSRVQLIKSLIVTEPAPVYVHQDILAEINFALSSFVRRHSLGKVLVSPVDVYFDDEHVFQPDILFIAAQRLQIIKENGIYGAPDLVVEILSPSTENYDPHQKKQVYERCGVKEYWLINPKTRTSEGFMLENRTFLPLPPSTACMHSPFFGETFRF